MIHGLRDENVTRNDILAVCLQKRSKIGEENEDLPVAVPNAPIFSYAKMDVKPKGF